MKVLNRYRMKHANRINKHHLRSFSRTRNYSFKAFQAEPWWESRYADGLYEWDRRDSLLSLFLHLSYLNQILVHVFWYRISSRCTDTSGSKALKGWSHRSPSSPPRFHSKYCFHWVFSRGYYFVSTLRGGETLFRSTFRCTFRVTLDNQIIKYPKDSDSQVPEGKLDEKCLSILCSVFWLHVLFQIHNSLWSERSFSWQKTVQDLFKMLSQFTFNKDHKITQ